MAEHLKLLQTEPLAQRPPTEHASGGLVCDRGEPQEVQEDPHSRAEIFLKMEWFSLLRLLKGRGWTKCLGSSKLQTWEQTRRPCWCLCLQDQPLSSLSQDGEETPWARGWVIVMRKPKEWYTPHGSHPAPPPPPSGAGTFLSTELWEPWGPRWAPLSLQASVTFRLLSCLPAEASSVQH